MRSTYGENLKLSIFGASHDPQIGMTLDGIPAGLPVDNEKLQSFLNRRAPGQNSWSTPRKEADIPHFLSGLTDGVTNGDTIHAVIYNQNVRKADYDDLKYIPRPGHADYAAWMKYGLDFDMSGGGPFSGRMTAPMCIAGGLCKQWLERKGIRIGAHISMMNDLFDVPFDPIAPQLDDVLSTFPVLHERSAEIMQRYIAEEKADGNSIGGMIECAITGLPSGIGGPMFGSMEGHIAQIVYGIPAIKSISFGNVGLTGSMNNDEFVIIDGKVRTKTNHCGGILGGISTGMPVIFHVDVKPTPSISKPQRSVNLKTMEEVTIQIKGRHDPCIVPRAVPVVEAAAAIAIYDLLLGASQTERR